MTITEVSKMYGLTQDTLRYYERIGLIPKVNRNKSGKRDYSEDDCKWIEFIKCMKGAGLPIETLIEYVSLFQEGEETAGARKEILIEQRKVLIEKLDELQKTVQRLDRKIAVYDNDITKDDKLS